MSRSCAPRWPGRPWPSTGEFYPLPLPDGAGKALKLGFHPYRADIPIYLAAVGPQNLELAGEIADGWLAIFFSPGARGRAARLDHGGPGEGRQGPRWLRCGAPAPAWSSATTRSLCADPLRGNAALYVGGMGSREQNFYNQLAVRMGFGDAAREVQDLYLSRRQRDAAAAVPFDFIDQTSLLGPVDAGGRAAAPVRRGRRDHAVGQPVRRATANRRSTTLRQMAEAFDRSGLAG